MEAKLNEAKAEQQRLRAARPAPPPVSTVAPQGNNVRRSWVAAPVVETAEEDAPTVVVAERAPVDPGFTSAPFDEDGPQWPDAAAESAFLGTQELPALAAPAGAEETSSALPALDELTGRLPASTRDALEELFRARFVSVKRIPKGWLKEGTP